MEDFEDVQKLAEDIINKLNFDIVELAISKKQDITNIDIMADRYNGGIMVDECVSINRAICHKLDEIGILGEDYQVQVSSPGLDRALKTQKDFARVIGRKIRFHLNDLCEGKKEHHGKINSVDESNVNITTVKDGDISIPLQLINKAVQIIETK